MGKAAPGRGAEDSYAHSGTFTGDRLRRSNRLELSVDVRANFAIEVNFFVLRGNPFHGRGSFGGQMKQNRKRITWNPFEGNGVVCRTLETAGVVTNGNFRAATNNNINFVEREQKTEFRKSVRKAAKTLPPTIVVLERRNRNQSRQEK